MTTTTDDVDSARAADAPVELAALTPEGIRQVTARLLSPDFPEWSAAAARVGHCSRPVLLRGRSHTINSTTGEVLASYDSGAEFDGLTRVRCGNRRGSVCPACSREYAGDTWHLIAAGAAGGKGVPASVGSHPMVFATLTAPSFGAVHTAPKGGNRLCRPRRGGKVCAHGWPLSCGHRHTGGEAIVGRPLCPECYDYATHVIWQWHAPELWRRFTIALRRRVARLLGVAPSSLGKVATVQFAKVAEFQRRGVIHFHALIRLDGPRDGEAFGAPPAGLSADILADLVAESARGIELHVDGVDHDDPVRVLRFGTQLDSRAVTASGTDDGLSASQVAGYIAKYATKSITDSDFGDTRSWHLRWLRATVAELAERAQKAELHATDGEPGPYALLGKWVHMLGFRGHFSSKSRRYSTTLGALRGARRRWQTALARTRRNSAAGGLDVADLDGLADDETTLVIGEWQFVGMGWLNEGETALATAAAARAREYHRERAAARKSSTGSS